MTKTFYKNIERKTWSFYKGESKIPINTKFRFTNVQFEIGNKDGSDTRYYENCKQVRLGNAIRYKQKHHNNLIGQELAANTPCPNLSALTKVTLNVHNEPECGYIVLPSTEVAYVETRYVEEINNAVYDCWLNDAQLKEIGWLNHKENLAVLPEKQLALETTTPSTVANQIEDFNRIPFDPTNIQDDREKVTVSIVQRQGQPEFRQMLIKAYNGQCAITETNAEQALEAAHIIQYKGKESNHISNGLLLRADIHTLFDLGLISVNTETMTVTISSKLANTTYNDLQGRHLFLPEYITNRPSIDALNYHNKFVFKM